ncbi:hypothetical protein [Pseudomonas sp. OHS18]|uniref:hypothetical protein n=1 Tax=Pseudomonas sp. OHS18 TaxID=3399679 RepID=UPI003A86D068
MNLEENVEKILKYTEASFLTAGDFWINLVVGLAGVCFSLLAFVEAKKAKEAAAAAAVTVKMQSLTIELTEIAQRLDKIDYDIDFQEARNLLSESSRRLIRIIAPFQDKGNLADLKSELTTIVSNAMTALDNVRPENGQAVVHNAIYFAMQWHFSNISNLTAEITGIFEKSSIEAV